jgi:hypothetical protein
MERVISAFPATGKSYAAHHFPRVVDSDSAAFPKGRVTWPRDYIQHIKHNARLGKIVLASSHREVREAMFEATLPYTLVYPEHSLRGEYIARMERRGSPWWLVEKIDTLWDKLYDSMESDAYGTHIVLARGEYLSDALETVGWTTS